MMSAKCRLNVSALRAGNAMCSYKKTAALADKGAGSNYFHIHANRYHWPFGDDKSLFYFAFTEDHMLARPWIIFFQLKLFRLGAWVLFCHVEIASVGRAYEFNLKGRWLCHDIFSLMPCDTSQLENSNATKNQGENCVKPGKMSSLR